MQKRIYGLETEYGIIFTPEGRKTLPVETTRNAFAYVFGGEGKFCNASGPLAVPTEPAAWSDTTPPVEADNRSLLSRLGRQDIVDSVVGADTGLRQVMERVDLVAQSDAPVLILGETGSGK